MGKPLHHSSGLVEDLRLTIDCLPVANSPGDARWIRSGERIIAGAYVDGEGGVCPMLAAHRSGAPTAFLSFARSWDRFTRAGRGVHSVSRRQLNILVGQLQASLLSEADTALARAIEEHRALVAPPPCALR